MTLQQGGGKEPQELLSPRGTGGGCPRWCHCGSGEAGDHPAFGQFGPNLVQIPNRLCLPHTHSQIDPTNRSQCVSKGSRGRGLATPLCPAGCFLLASLLISFPPKISCSHPLTGLLGANRPALRGVCVPGVHKETP